MHYQLVVFPPGTRTREATWLHAWLGWPFAGTMLAVLFTLVIAGMVPVFVAVPLAVALLVGGHLGLRHVVWRQRRRVCVVRRVRQRPFLGALLTPDPAAGTRA